MNISPLQGSTTAASSAAESQDRRSASLSSLKCVCDSAVFGPHLEALLAAQDARGNTPFMAAVACRAYPAALVLFEAAQKVCVCNKSVYFFVF